MPPARAEARKGGRGLPKGSRVTVLATDPMAKVDIPFYCRKHGHDCTLTLEGEVLRFEVTAGG